MVIAALVIAVLALFAALAARGKASGFAARIDDVERDARRRAENVASEVERDLGVMRRLMIELAAGRPLDEDQILEGRLWRDIDTAGAKARIESGAVRFVDVRTPHEVAGGMIPGALHIPLDQLESRRTEIARDDKTTIVYCAGGARSADACEFLSGKGWTNLFNLEGGFQSWNGPVERPSA